VIDTRLSLLCRVGGHLAAVPLAHVIEIMRPLPMREVADVPPFVRGLSVVRGAAVPVLDVARMLGEAAAPLEGRLVCVRSGPAGERVVALLASEVIGVRRFTSAELAALPPLLRGAHGEALQALGALDRELLWILETASVIPDAAWSALEAAGERT
jgi:purine-binding chemotaxis protein CheW